MTKSDLRRDSRQNPQRPSFSVKGTSFRRPVLITAYNRPEKIRRLLNSLNPAEVSEIFFHVDGPLLGDKTDLARVLAVHSIIESFGKDASTHVNFQESNLGCRDGMHSALDWFFGEVESGMILEDDLVLGPSAIAFMSHFLRKPVSDRIWMVSGNKHSPFGYRSKASLSKIPHIWGWATWAERWQAHDKELTFWPEFRSSSEFDKIFHSSAVANSFRTEVDLAHARLEDTWDLGWMASMWRGDGFSVRPPANLVTNRGFDDEATHTRQRNHESDRPVFRLTESHYRLKEVYFFLPDAMEFQELKGKPTTRKLLRKLSNLLSSWNKRGLTRHEGAEKHAGQSE